MSIDEIFSKMASHMIEGMMVHEQLMNAYLFLNLSGYAACHEHHYLSETKGYIRLCHYKAEHLNSLIQSTFTSKNTPDIIPSSWFTSSREQVNASTRKQAMETALDTWINWEEETKTLYEGFYTELLNTDHVAEAEFVKGYILDVEDEIVYARNEKILKTAMAFDIVSILEEQNKVMKFFKDKIKKDAK